MNDTRDDLLFGVNPVSEALKARRPIRRVLIQRGRGGREIDAITAAAREAGVPLTFEPREALDRLTGTPKHQGVVAQTAGAAYRPFEALMAEAAQQPGGLFLVVLDGVEDPRNLGAIARTADAVGAGGLIVPQRRAAGITPTAMKASAGALAHLPVAQVTNLARALKALKDAGCWLVGLDASSSTEYTAVDYRGPLAVVLGHEGEGARDLTLKSCDFRVRIPMRGRMESLNVSVAAGVVLYEALRQRGTSIARH
ncbi:MAG: 23S rRNA (guanosine(2251)-2'-O)-methyltransferase RlmB [Nitrospiria bacterium]